MNILSNIIANTEEFIHAATFSYVDSCIGGLNIDTIESFSDTEKIFATIYKGGKSFINGSIHDSHQLEYDAAIDINRLLIDIHSSIKINDYKVMIVLNSYHIVDLDPAKHTFKIGDKVKETIIE